MADSTASYTTVSNEDFAEKVLQAPQMAVVNFSSARSSSCQIFEPEFAAIGQEYQGRVTFAQVDVDSNEELINQYTVEGIPTLIFFKNGQEINRIKGIVMRDRLRRQIEGALLVGSYPKSGDASYDNPSAG
ncbi:MAG TPA: thioredoxin domain-containing protein [Ktedonobacteraceae bacterium]|jgi:thioredoxin 1|nr:thioredoxin domain-containing protein [Ktedonobacteraceae bacterium]